MGGQRAARTILVRSGAASSYMNSSRNVVEASASSYSGGVGGRGPTMHGWMIYSRVNNLYLAKSNSEKLHHHEFA